MFDFIALALSKCLCKAGVNMRLEKLICLLLFGRMRPNSNKRMSYEACECMANAILYPWMVTLQAPFWLFR